MLWRARTPNCRSPTTLEQGTGRSRREHDEDDVYEDRQPRERKPEDRKPDLNTFTLKHRKISALTTKHLCASCTYWTGATYAAPGKRRPLRQT